MSTDVRPILSKKNQYWISKHRFYELKHFCMQFMDWQRERAALDGLAYREERSPTEPEAILRAGYSKRIQMIMRAAEQTDGVIGDYILVAVTKGLSYEALNARSPIPCCKSTYYELYRKFFWLLDKLRE